MRLGISGAANACFTGFPNPLIGPRSWCNSRHNGQRPDPPWLRISVKHLSWKTCAWEFQGLPMHASLGFRTLSLDRGYLGGGDICNCSWWLLAGVALSILS